MANKDNRQLREMNNLFGDPKFARQVWKAVGNAIAARPATKPVAIYDKDGNETPNSQIESYAYRQLANDVERLATSNPEPTMLEMILMSQMIKARTDTAAATFIRDTLGAKPVDESKIEQTNNNPYETLTDEELQLIHDMRKRKALSVELDSVPDAPLDVPLVEQTIKETSLELVKLDTNIYIGDDNDVEYARQHNLRILHCAKRPWHVYMAGDKLSHDDPNYMYIEKDGEAALNLVDSDDYAEQFQELFNVAIQKAFAFLDEVDCPVFIHCNKGESRSPAIALLYIHHKRLSEKTFDELLDIYNFKPRGGIYNFVKRAWDIV